MHADPASRATTDAVSVNRPAAPHPAPEQDLAFEGLYSYGNWMIFAGGSNAKMYTSGVEYDRNSWGTFAGARMDYVAEFLPVMFLNEPAKTDVWGDTRSSARTLAYGMGLSPVGLRMVWRDHRAIKPYFLVKGGVLVWDKKVLSPAATYENFTLQEALGFLVRATPRYDLRFGLFGDFHFSNAFMVPSNPGLDVMNATFAISYHLGRGKTE